MRKRVISLLLILTFSLIVAVGTISQNLMNDHEAQPTVILYDNDRFCGKASSNSTDFTTSKGSGNTIRVSYDNQENAPVKVTLYQYGWFGTKNDVLVLNISGNDQGYQEYTASKADHAKYYVNVQAEYGDDITGSLRVNQIS